MYREILEQITDVSSHVTLSVCLKKHLERQWTEIFPAAPVQILFPFIDIYLYIVTRLFMFPLPSNTDLLMRLFLALVANPTINKYLWLLREFHKQFAS